MAPLSFPDRSAGFGAETRMFPSASQPPDITMASFDLAHLPIPVNMGQSRLSVSLTGGFPEVEFALDLLNGTITGSAGLIREQDQYYLRVRTAFSGIDSAVLISDAAARTGGETEINGALSARIPVTGSMRTLLENARVQLYFSRIGSRALERILYALDPYESNEAIMSQRRLLRTGSPKEIRLGVENGFLSLDGSVAAGSITIDIPRLQRLNVAEIPGIKKFEPSLAGLGNIISMLDILTAQTLLTDPANHRIRFRSP